MVGPSTVSLSTQNRSSRDCDVFPLIKVNCVQLDRYEQNLEFSLVIDSVKSSGQIT